jgi:hypothetical protein
MARIVIINGRRLQPATSTAIKKTGGAITATPAPTDNIILCVGDGMKGATYQSPPEPLYAKKKNEPKKTNIKFIF